VCTVTGTPTASIYSVARETFPTVICVPDGTYDNFFNVL